jgi:general secretion pathway protein M
VISVHTVSRCCTRYPGVSAAVYAALVIVLCLTTIFSLTDLVEQYRARNTLRETLSRLDRRNDALSAQSGSWPAGSPFLQGKSATVASAALLQQITNTVTRVGGTVISTEIERRGTRSKNGYVTVTATFDIEQAPLQNVLYDIEAGMPFLFVDHLNVGVPTPPRDDGRVHVVLSVSGLWLGAR